MKAYMPVKAKALDDEAAWFAGKIPRRLLAIPFGGPIPSAKSPLGVDYDGEWFSERTDIYGGARALRENRERLVDFSHAFAPPDHRYGDPTGMMSGHILGKSILDPDPEEDGWWVDLWLKAGDRRVKMIQALAHRGAELFGSSQPLPGKTSRTDDGEITVWPFIFETLSPAPSNTYSVLRPAKAMLEEADLAGIAVPAAMRELLNNQYSLDASLKDPSLVGGLEAKSGRELSRINDQEIEAALAELDEGYGKASARLRSLIERVRARYAAKE
jgi:hypothetical protein